MDKLTIATKVLLKLIETNKTGFDAEGIAGYAWEIADAMQAEADKREDKMRPEVLRTENSPQLDIHGLLHSLDEYFDQAECTKTDRMANNLLAEIYEKLSGEVNSVREWQPDWSQSPEWANWWAMDGFLNKANWYKTEPFLDDDEWNIVLNNSDTYKEAPSFDYQGNWQDSLRKRPQ